MRLLLTLLFCLKYGSYSARGQQSDVLGQVRLQLYFDPFYNRFDKACCKFSPSGCLVFLDNRGYVDSYYKGRIILREFNGGIEVTIWNLQRSDAGYYRCTILGTTGNLIYKDSYVEIVDTISHLSPLPPTYQPSSQGTTIKSLPTSPETSAVLSDIQEEPRFTWKVLLLVGAGFGLILLVAMTAVLMAVLQHRKRGKDKDRGKPVGPSDSILPHTREEEAPIIYTEVDFKPHGETNELYANVFMQSPRTTRAKLSVEPLDTVEYSTVARSL
ncbi:hypothetical protein ACEWY4_000911 [Coilia grayii]|uniref:Immunoglobulin subtype domain-containing protein n=1 Tax=Coilia grayii TaxID=363190 RepID=A0ABD1KZA8_9TELE